jgi:hypothetical protein
MLYLCRMWKSIHLTNTSKWIVHTIKISISPLHLERAANPSPWGPSRACRQGCDPVSGRLSWAAPEGSTCGSVPGLKPCLGLSRRCREPEPELNGSTLSGERRGLRPCWSGSDSCGPPRPWRGLSPCGKLGSKACQGLLTLCRGLSPCWGPSVGAASEVPAGSLSCLYARDWLCSRANAFCPVQPHRTCC